MIRYHVKALVLVAVLLAIPAGLFAGGQEELTDEQITIRMWFGREEFIPADNFEVFHQENPNIRVEPEVTPLEDAAMDLIRNHEVGTDPDIAQIVMTYTGTLAERGILQDMSSEFERWLQEDPELYESIAEVAWQSASFNGVPYGMSAHATAIWHVWRVDWLEAAGVDGVPATFAETIDAAIQVRDSGNLESGQYPYAISGSSALSTQISFYAYFMAMGGQFSDDGVPIVDSEEGRYLVEFYRTLVEEELINPDSLAWNFGEVRGAFTGGNTGMMVMGANVFPAFIDAGLEYGDDATWIATPQPYRDGAESEWQQYGNAFPYVVSSNTDHPAEVAKVLRYLNRADIVGEVAARYQPATNRKVSEESDLREQQPWLAPLHETWLNLTAHPTQIRQAQINDIVIEMVQEILDEPDVDADELVRRVQAELDALN